MDLEKIGLWLIMHRQVYRTVLLIFVISGCFEKCVIGVFFDVL